ncbi:MAG TPA: sulfatase [Candidatus Brocadiia bacterium]|nr:sulfatase [Candidatus Brocadiia bacterium]
MKRCTRREFARSLGIGVAALAAPGLIGCAAPGVSDGRKSDDSADDSAQPVKNRRRPNIVFILADDMGWMDSTVYGSRYYETPNLERLAARGMTFTDAYAANPLCSPTRASILAGQYPARLRITTPSGHLPPLENDPLMPESARPWEKMICPRSRHYLPFEERTIAEALRDAGYRTAFVGKWHLGQEPYWPERQGFEVNIGGGHYPSPPSYHSPYKIKTLPDGPDGEYITDRLTGEALNYIERNKDAPFFLCLWHYAVHGPWGHKEEITKTFEGRSDPRGKQGNPIMASMLKSLDESVGRVLDKLDALGLSDDTILIFFSDNGGNVHERIGPDLLPPTDNFPLRGGKAMIYEGGTREPLIVCWPGAVAPGSRCSEVVSSVDFYPTILEAAGGAAAPGQVLDGVSITPLLRQTGKLSREAIFCHFPHEIGTLIVPCTYVRKGDWKLIRFHMTNDDFPNRFELYNLREDISETVNLAERMPDKVAELDALIGRFLLDTGALVPVPNPDYDPKTAPVDRWFPSRDCRISRAGGALVIESAGPDPFIQTGDVPKESGEMLIAFRMRSSSAGGGQFFWATGASPQFGPKLRLDFQPVHDGVWHEYEVRFTASHRLQSVRIDPSTAPGRIELDRICLLRADGRELKTWDFGGAAGGE